VVCCSSLAFPEKDIKAEIIMTNPLAKTTCPRRSIFLNGAMRQISFS